jgi:hypothetical protein
MSKSKETKKQKEQKERAKFALRRIAEDEEVQAHLRIAAIRAREAWARASGRPGSKAVEDRKIYDKIREAATSLAQAGQKLQRKPEPPKHRARNAAIVAAGAGGAAYAFKKRRGRSGGSESFAAPGSSVDAHHPPAETTSGTSGYQASA